MPPFTSNPAVGASTSPSTAPNDTLVIFVHHDATSFLQSFGKELLRRPIEANLVLAIASKAARLEELESSHPRLRQAPIWVSVGTRVAEGRRVRLDFIAAFTSSRLDTYPLFFYPAHAAAVYTPEFTRPRVALLVEELIRYPHAPSRLFSVFAPAPLSEEFSRQWSAVSRRRRLERPHFSSVLTTVTRDTLDGSMIDEQAYQHSRRATMADLTAVAVLFDQFAAGSGFYAVTSEQALIQASQAIREGFVWLYELESQGVRTPIGVVAALRNSPGHAFITKVFIEEEHRRNGLGKRLVAWVCDHLLFDQGYDDVSLYVDEQQTPDAAALYDKVGFMGLCGRPRPPHVEPWVEIAFENTIKGHW